MTAALENPELGGKLVELGVMLLALVGILWGVAQCFLGYRIIRIVLGFWGFLCGLQVGIILGLFVTRIAGPGAIIITVLCGIAGAVLAVLSLYIGIFLLGAGLAAGGALVLHLSLGGGDGRLVWMILLAAAVAGGIVALVFRRFVIILTTSLGGAAEVVIGALVVMGDPLALAAGRGALEPGAVRELVTGRHLTALLCWAGLSVAGMVVQYSSARGREAVGKRDKNLDALLAHAKADR